MTSGGHDHHGTHPPHSGSYGGAVPDSLTALVRLLASLVDDRGAAQIQGLEWGEPHGGSDVSADEVRSGAGLLPGVDLVGRGCISDRLWTKAWRPGGCHAAYRYLAGGALREGLTLLG